MALQKLLENAGQVSLGEIQTNPQEWVDEIEQCGSVMERIMTTGSVSFERLRYIYE